MTTAKTATSGTIDAEITIADLQNIRSSTATGTIGSTVPGPTIVADETTSACAESIILSITLGQGRGVMDIGFANLTI